ncbi:hypothetical protein ACTFIZ_004189 [Dictyostelium cf. discoideum]
MNNLQILHTNEKSGKINITELDFSGFSIEIAVNLLIHDFILIHYSHLSLANEIEMVKINSLKDLESMYDFYNRNFGQGNPSLVSQVVGQFSNNIVERAKNVISTYDGFEKETMEFEGKLRNLLKDSSFEKNQIEKSKIKFKNLTDKRNNLQEEVNKSKRFFRYIFRFFYSSDINKKNELLNFEKQINEINENMTEQQMEKFIKNAQFLKECITNATHHVLNIKSNLKNIKLINQELLKNDFILFCSEKELMCGLYSQTKNLLTNSNSDLKLHGQ